MPIIISQVQPRGNICFSDKNNSVAFTNAIVIIATCWFHSSNLLILPLSAFVLVALQWRDRMGRSTRLAWAAGVPVLAWCSLAVANGLLDGNAQPSRNSHAFLVGRMADLGMLGPYLDAHCGTEPYGLCMYRDSLPTTSEAFLWGDDSPLWRQGGWDATREEYDRIFKGSLTDPRFLLWHAWGSIASTAKQLTLWEVCRSMRSDWYRTPSSPPYAMIAKFVPHDHPRYMAALQNGGRGELSMWWPDLLYRIGLTAALILTGRAIFRRSAAPETRRFILFAFTGTIIGAWVCASLSMPDGRYLSRDSWILPFAVVLHVASQRARRKSDGLALDVDHTATAPQLVEHT